MTEEQVGQNSNKEVPHGIVKSKTVMYLPFFPTMR